MLGKSLKIWEGALPRILRGHLGAQKVDIELAFKYHTLEHQAAVI